MQMGLFGRHSVREQQHKVREDAIFCASHAPIARQGYDLMTVDEVSAAAGMIRLLERALAFLASLQPEMPGAYKVRAVLRWAGIVTGEHLTSRLEPRADVFGLPVLSRARFKTDPPAPPAPRS